MHTKPLNKIALKEVMQLAQKNASASASNTDTNNNSNNDDDDIISPRIRAFMKTLNENDIELIDADEEAQKLIFKLKSDSSTEKYIAEMSIIAQIVGDDIVFFFTSHGRTYSLISAIMENSERDYIASFVAKYTEYINRAFESLRDHSIERHKDLIR